jgi:hypothetical protein
MAALHSGVGGNDQKFNFIVFIGSPEEANLIGNRIGPALTNFNFSGF